MESHSLMPSKESSWRQNVEMYKVKRFCETSCRLEKLTCGQLYFRVF